MRVGEKGIRVRPVSAQGTTGGARRMRQKVLVGHKRFMLFSCVDVDIEIVRPTLEMQVVFVSNCVKL